SLLFNWHLTHGVEHYPFRLLQVNLITGAAVALVWLGTRRLGRGEFGQAVPGILPSLQVLVCLFALEGVAGKHAAERVFGADELHSVGRLRLPALAHGSQTF